MRYIEVEKAYCKGCGLCVAVCPQEILALEDEFTARGYRPARLVDGGECTGCCSCAVVCPDAAIQVFVEK